MGTITIGKKDITVKEEWMNQQDLAFFIENPRVYTALRENGNEKPTQPEIEVKMRSMEHVKDLKGQIEQNGGLIEPLVVVKRADEYVVIEGNSRLAAYRILAEANPAKWGKVRVNILPEDITDDDIDTLLGTYHLTPKKDWSKYEKAAYVYRMKKKDNCPDATVAKKSGLSIGTVRKYLQVYEFMVKHDDTTQSHWNSYEQYIINKDLGKYRETYPEMDGVVVKQIKTGEIKQAQDIRDKLAKVAKATDKTSNRIMRDFICEKVDVYDAYTRFEATGKSGNNYNKIKNFRSLMTSDDFKLALKTESVDNNNIAFELKKIKKEVDKLLDEISKAKH